MTATMMNCARDWIRGMLAAGFRESPNGSFRSQDFAAEATSRWVTFRRMEDPALDSLNGQTNRIGLWKIVVDPDQGARYELSLPANLVGTGQDEPEGDDSPLSACIRWVLTTAAGRVPGGWECPPRETVESWIPAGGLSVQRGPFAVQGKLTCEGSQLRVTFPLVHGLLSQLSDHRRGWLRKTLEDAQNRWRLVRLVICDEPGRAGVVAEIDLSGAPPDVLEELFKVSLAALRWVVSWLIVPVCLLADPAAKCGVWELPPENF